MILDYMSPEMVTVERNPSGYGRAIDIWAVGCIVLEMATGKVRFIKNFRFDSFDSFSYRYLITGSNTGPQF